MRSMKRVPEKFLHRCGKCIGVTEFLHTPNSEEIKGHRFECATCTVHSVLIVFKKVVYCFHCRIMTEHRYICYDSKRKDYWYRCGKCRSRNARIEPHTDEKL